MGNHTTALFWEYDTRIGRRHNLDPKAQVSISDYATNRNNPLSVNDPNGNSPTIAIGLITGSIKAGWDYAGQVLANKSKGMTWGQSLKQVDVADIAISFGQGFADGASLGLSTLVTQRVANGLKASIDIKTGTGPGQHVKMLGGGFLFGKQYDKRWERVATDYVSSEISTFISNKSGKMFDDALRKLTPADPGFLSYYGSRTVIQNMFGIPGKVILTNAKELGFKEYFRWKYRNAHVTAEPASERYEDGSDVPEGNKPQFTGE